MSWLLILALGCGEPTIDDDADGWPAALDCDDADATVHPSAAEDCDPVDRDCDGDPTAGAAGVAWYLDADDDGFGGTVTLVACAAPTGWVATSTDCDDLDGAVHPSASEACNGKDDDCNEQIDDGAPGTAWYADADDDGYGDAAQATTACVQPADTVSNALDCDDLRDDVHPGAEERCDAVDHDCDEDPTAGATDAVPWHLDLDRDGFGDPDLTVTACAAPARYVADGTDCDDLRADVHPGADELCDGISQDCDPDIDELALDRHPVWVDVDHDGYGDERAAPVLVCDDLDSAVGNALDCSDTDDTVHPGAAETCGPDDRDCDGDPEAGAIDALPLHEDADGDGFFAVAITWACDPSGLSATGTDCEDDDPTAFPGSTAPETPHDGVDTDCDGVDACTDLNCDGLPDVLLGCEHDDDYDCETKLLLTHHGPALVPGATLPQYGTTKVEAADLNSDGYVDLVFAFQHNQQGGVGDSAVVWGSAEGYSWDDRTDLYADGPQWVVLGDLDGDTDSEVVFCGYSGGSGYFADTVVHWNDDGAFTRSTVLDGEGVTTCTIALVDADPFPDLVLPGYYDGDHHATSFVYWGSPTGPSNDDRLELPSYSTQEIAVADLDGDGFNELIAANYYQNGWDTVSWIWWGSADGWSEEDRTDLPTYGPGHVRVADLDKDGFLDLVFPSKGGTGAYADSYVYWGSADGYSVDDRTDLPSENAYDLEVVDLDGDGWLDVVFTGFGHSDAATAIAHFGSGAGFVPGRAVGFSTIAASAVDVADMNGDGRLDLLFTGDGNSASNTSFVYIADEGRSYVPIPIPTNHAAWDGIFVGR